MVTEFEAGRGFKGPYGDYMHLDVRHLGEEVVDRKLPFMRELGREYMGIDIVNDPIPIRPVEHYMMGASTPTSTAPRRAAFGSGAARSWLRGRTASGPSSAVEVGLQPTSCMNARTAESASSAGNDVTGATASAQPLAWAGALPRLR